MCQAWYASLRSLGFFRKALDRASNVKHIGGRPTALVHRQHGTRSAGLFYIKQYGNTRARRKMSNKDIPESGLLLCNNLPARPLPVSSQGQGAREKKRSGRKRGLNVLHRPSNVSIGTSALNMHVERAACMHHGYVCVFVRACWLEWWCSNVIAEGDRFRWIVGWRLVMIVCAMESFGDCPSTRENVVGMKRFRAEVVRLCRRNDESVSCFPVFFLTFSARNLRDPMSSVWFVEWLDGSVSEYVLDGSESSFLFYFSFNSIPFRLRVTIDLSRGQLAKICIFVIYVFARDLVLRADMFSRRSVKIYLSEEALWKLPPLQVPSRDVQNVTLQIQFVKGHIYWPNSPLMFPGILYRLFIIHASNYRVCIFHLRFTEFSDKMVSTCTSDTRWLFDQYSNNQAACDIFEECSKWNFETRSWRTI